MQNTYYQKIETDMMVNLKEEVPLKRDMAATIDELVILSKIDNKLDRLSKNIGDSIDNDINSMSEIDFKKYKKILVSVLRPSILKKDVRRIISERDCQKQLVEIVHFLGRPLVKLMANKEEESKSPDAMKEMQCFFSELAESPPTDERKLLIEHIDKIRNLSSSAIDVNGEIFQAITWGMRKYIVSDQVMTSNQLKQIRLDRKKQIEPLIKQQVWIGMLYAYKNISDNDLKAYISLCETSAGKLANKLVQLVYQVICNKTAKRIQDRLEAVFGSGHISP